jgi:hypothetical protein
MHEVMMDRVRELYESYGVGVSARTEKGYKFLEFVGEDNTSDFSNQGAFVWMVHYYKNEGEGEDMHFGPMDSRELMQQHPELFFNNTEVVI